MPTARGRLLPVLVVGAGVVLVAVIAMVPLGGRPPASAGPDGSRVVVGGSPLLGKPAPPIALMDLDGSPVSLAALAGRPVIVNFWASWCVPCRDEFPMLVETREAHADDGLEILGVIYRDGPEAARRFAEDQGAEWPLLLDPEDRVYRAYQGVSLVPISVFIDRQGIVRAVTFGPFSEAGLASDLARILPSG